MQERLVALPGRQVPVLLEVDVVVVGGGFAGVCAAVGAARAGARAAIVERDGMLGGQSAEVYTFGLDAVIHYATGRQIIRGLPWEIIRRTAAQGQSDPMWDRIDFGCSGKERLFDDLLGCENDGLPLRPETLTGTRGQETHQEQGAVVF